jgi:histidinol-phosphatase (PHP family)
MKKNYHTHTYRCKHAQGDIIDYAALAYERGMNVLGITEHTPLPDGRWNNVRMDMDQLDSYDSAFITAAEAYPALELLKGMECDWIPEYKNFYMEEFIGKRNFCYLIGSVHWFRSGGEWIFSYTPEASGRAADYADTVIEMIESETFDFIGHPDLFALFSRKWNAETKAVSRAICEAAKTYKIPLEINGYGLRKSKIETAEGIRHAYPYEKFWEIASEYGIDVICNSDAHLPDDVDKSIDLCMEIADRNYLTLADFKPGRCGKEILHQK